jgi:hypothetical protein
VLVRFVWQQARQVADNRSFAQGQIECQWRVQQTPTINHRDKHALVAEGLRIRFKSAKACFTRATGFDAWYQRPKVEVQAAAAEQTLWDQADGPSDRNRTCIWRLGGARSIH